MSGAFFLPTDDALANEEYDIVLFNMIQLHEII